MAGARDRSGETVRAGSARITLGRLIKSGGAGSVYLLPQRPQSVAKLYHDHLHPDAYDRKVAAMLALSPDLPVREERGERYVQIAWPTELVHDARGRFLGFLMPLLDIAATSELEAVLQERQAAAQGLPTGLGAKVTLAANLAAVVAALHRKQHYVVDLKPVNLRFYRKSLYIALLDCDGFSIRGNGERFRASQFTPDYLAPECQRNGIASDGEQAQDLFALAVVIFRLLNFGIHPFTGKPASQRVPTDIPGRIRAGCYAYGRTPNPAMAPSPVSGHALMPGELREMFDRAFGGRSRPGAEEWAGLLARYARRDGGQLVRCTRNPAHQHFSGLACAACARAQLLDRTRRQARTRPRRTQQPAGVVQTTPAGVRRGTPQPAAAPASLRGCLIPLAFVAFVLVMIVRSCGGDDPPRSEDAASSRPPRVERMAQSTIVRAREAMPPIVPVASRPDPARMERTTLATMQAMVAKDTAAYAVATADMAAIARSYPRPQPASLQAYVVELARRPPADEAFETRSDAYRAIVDADPYASFAAIELGTRLLIRGRMDDARPLFTLAVSVDPRNSTAWYGLGTSYLGQDNDLAAAAIAIAELHFSDAPEADRVPMVFEMTLAARQDALAQLRSAREKAESMVEAMRGEPVPGGDSAPP